MTMPSDLSFVGFGEPKKAQLFKTATPRQRCASVTEDDTEGLSPASPTAGCPSCRPEGERPRVIAVGRPDRCACQRLGGNRSTDRSGERSAGLAAHPHLFPPLAGEASRCRRTYPADLYEWSFGWRGGAVRRVEAIEGDRRTP